MPISNISNSFEIGAFHGTTPMDHLKWLGCRPLASRKTKYPILDLDKLKVKRACYPNSNYVSEDCWSHPMIPDKQSILKTRHKVKYVNDVIT